MESTAPASQLPESGVLVHFPDFLTLYTDGRVLRQKGTERVPAGVDSATGVTSKDVVINPQSGLSARLYLPPPITSSSVHESTPASAKKRLPLLIYFHGGGFCIESAFSPLYHSYLNSIVAESGAVAVSVEYRLAPENPIPASHLDCWEALQWVASHAVSSGSEPWLVEYADFQRVYLAGDSAGGNLTHHMALSAGGHAVIPGMKRETLDIPSTFKVEGIILIHPFFWGSVLLEKEKTKPTEWITLIVGLWKLVSPDSVGMDDPMINPLANADTAGALAGLGCRKVLIAVAEDDIVRERGWWYYEALKSCGWEAGAVEIVETPAEGHVFHLFKPECEEAKRLLKRFASFITHKS